MNWKRDMDWERDKEQNSGMDWYKKGRGTDSVTENGTGRGKKNGKGTRTGNGTMTGKRAWYWEWKKEREW